MSADPKKDDEKAVFDEGEFGPGHNQGPPLDEREAIAAEAEADANADTETQPLKRGRRSGSSLSQSICLTGFAGINCSRKRVRKRGDQKNEEGDEWVDLEMTLEWPRCAPGERLLQMPVTVG